MATHDLNLVKLIQTDNIFKEPERSWPQKCYAVIPAQQVTPTGGKVQEPSRALRRDTEGGQEAEEGKAEKAQLARKGWPTRSWD